MEKQNQSSLSLLALLPDGKVENDVRITDKTVTGICTVYVKRTDNEQEFLLREIGVAALEGGNLTDAVRIAVNQAYDAAISRISGMAPAAVSQQQQTSEKTQSRGAKPIPGLKQELKQEPPAPEPDVEDADEAQDTGDARETDEPESAPDTGTDKHMPVDLGSIVDLPGETEDTPSAQEDTPEAHGDTPGAELRTGNTYTGHITGFSETAYFVRVNGVPMEVRCPINSNNVMDMMGAGDHVKFVVRGVYDGIPTGSIRKIIKKAVVNNW